MSRLRLLVLGTVAAATACIVQNPPPAVTPVSNQTPVAAPAGGVPPEGNYTCRIDDYPWFPCRISRVDGRLYLEKLAGSQRFRGFITQESPTAFGFDGEFFCPWGECNQPVSVRFQTVDNGVYQGTMSTHSQLNVVLSYLPDGGAGYGGDGYGGYGYGGYGYGYGGAAYGYPD